MDGAAAPRRRRGSAAASAASCAGGAAVWAPAAAVEVRADGRLVEFQRNAAFVAFIGIVAVAAISLLVDELRSVLIPLIWATFFALPLERTVNRLNKLLIQLFSAIIGLCRDEGSLLHSVAFRRRPGRNSFIIANSSANRALIDRLRNPFVGSSISQALMSACGLVDRRVLSRPCRTLGCKCAVIVKCCQRRLRITQVARPVATPSDEYQRPLNCVRENWCYYVGHASVTDANELQLQLFLDQGCCDYPAIVEGLPEDDAGAQGEETGAFEMDRTSPFSWMVAILLVAILVVGGLCAVGILLYLAANSFVQNLDSYELGVAQLIDWLKEITRNKVTKEFWDDIRTRLQEFLRTFLATYVESFLSGFSTVLFQLVLFFIYLLFWLFEPIPVSSPVVEVFKTYLFLKSLICLLFALLMSGTLFCLGCQLWPLFFVVTFVLNYIPEIGALISGLVSLPAVLLDASAGSPQERCWKAVYLVVLGLLYKFVTGNIIEVHMYTTRGGEFMRMHSVVLMALIMVFGQMLGITGMFLSVPIVAATKYYLISANIPPKIVDPLLCFIEGDELAVHKTFVDKTMASRADVPSPPTAVGQPPGAGAGEAPAPHMGEPLLLELGGSLEAAQQPQRQAAATSS